MVSYERFDQLLDNTGLEQHIETTDGHVNHYWHTGGVTCKSPKKKNYQAVKCDVFAA